MAAHHYGISALDGDAYDMSERNVLRRMIDIMIEENDLENEDFDGMDFYEIESLFLDTYGHEDFRPEED